MITSTGSWQGKKKGQVDFKNQKHSSETEFNNVQDGQIQINKSGGLWDSLLTDRIRWEHIFERKFYLPVSFGLMQDIMTL